MEILQGCHNGGQADHEKDSFLWQLLQEPPLFEFEFAFELRYFYLRHFADKVNQVEER